MGKYYSETIKKGSSGESVKEWQRYLNTQGYNLTVDGIFGDNTHNATTDYQTKNGLGVDGIVGANTWGKAGYSDSNTPVSAPTIQSAAPAPTYENVSWDDTEKGKGALDAYNSALAERDNYGPYQFSQEELFKSVMDKILNREDFTYDFNGDALYQQYKDKYIKQGKMAMGDAIGQASAMTGGYGNSYAQSVGQQAYQAQLENLNDIIPDLYQMALDKYNMDGQELYNQYGMLSAENDREYGRYMDGYDMIMDKIGITRGDYYDGANMHYTEQDTKNDIASKEFNDAMAIINANNENAWKQATWEEDARRWEIENARAEDANRRSEEAHNATYGSSSSGGSSGGSTGGSSGGSSSGGSSGSGSGSGNGGGTKSAAYDSVAKNANNYSSEQGQANYLAGQVNAGNITEAEAMDIIASSGVVDLVNRSWEMVDDGGINWFGIGIDANAKVKDQFGNTYTLAELRKELKKTMSTKEANEYIKELEEKLGI